MARPSKWFCCLVVALAMLVWLAPDGQARVRRPRAGNLDFSQCANGPTGIGQCVYEGGNLGWITGDLNQSKSLYREGDFVPIRLVVTDLVAGQRYTQGIGYDAVDDGLHTYDYLGTYDASENWPGPPAPQVVPCGGIADTAGPHACGSGPSTLAVPTDPYTTFPSGSGQAAGHFSAWGATLEGATYSTSLSTPIGVNNSGTIARGINLTFTANGPTAVLAWGGHIASVLDWGQGKTFKTGGGSGASWHMRLTAGGNRELSINDSGIAAQPASFSTQVNPTSVAIGQPVIDTATLTAPSGGAPVTGDVQFFVCGPSTSPPNCTQGGTAIQPPPIVLRLPVGPNGTVSIAYVPVQTGNYCFRAEYTPSATAPYSPALHTNTTTECFVATLSPPRLTVTKFCVPTTDPGLFNLLVDGSPWGGAAGTDVPCGGSAGPFDATVGAHTVSETGGTGTNLGNYTASIGGDCSLSGLVTLALGDVATCTITNVLNTAPPPAELTVHKVCDPTSDPGQFEIQANGVGLGSVGCGESVGPVPLAPGPYTVSEVGIPPTSAADYMSAIAGACDGNGLVMLNSGQSVECTITNTRIPEPPTTLRVDKACYPASDNGRFDVTIDTMDGHRVHQTEVGCGGTTGSVAVPAGEYTVSETGAGGTDLGKYDVVIGGDCDDAGNVAVAAGQQATCLITNVRKSAPPPATLSVTKICVPADDGGRFNLKIDGQTKPDAACGDTFGPVAVAPGQHQVSESAGTGTSLSDYTTTIGGACAPDGSITLAAGDSATCTITNMRKSAPPETGTLEIQKQCSPAGTTGEFQIEFDGDLFLLSCGESTGPVEVGLGHHQIGEVAVNDSTSMFATTIGGDCAADGSVTVNAGEHLTCLVTNTVEAPIEPPKPPHVCHALSVARRMVTVGRRVRVLARVHVGSRGIRGVRVYARGPGVFAVRTTGPGGRALFVLKLRRHGILRISIRKPYRCPKPPPHDIGIQGVQTPPVTG
jgi:hypothetical protein